MSQTGQLSIHAENILPIIKKWLYSEKDIFLRELVSNAIDAMHKVNKIVTTDELRDNIGDSKVSIKIDKEAKTLTITDTGIGMTAEEVKKYIAQVAFSGVQDYVEKYQGKEDDQQIIGHFGLGFYSCFMVASKVEVDTLSCRKDTEAVRWVSEGKIDYTLEESSRTEPGTSIVLHIGEDSTEMLEVATLRQILNKYCSFMPYPVELDGEVINEAQPLWTKSPSELEDKDYIEFFHKLFPMSPDPLFWIHLNVDFPFKLKGILYFPKLKHELDASQGEVKLFCNQVYVADNCKELLPEFLTLLKGAIDCPDLPLNVSRSHLQNDPHVRKISQHILKKVGDKVVGLAKTEEENYKKYWDDIAPFLKFGMMRENSFHERLIDHVLFKTTEGTYLKLQEYIDNNGEKTDKKLLYTTDPAAQASYIELHKSMGIDVIVADSMIDAHFLQHIEMQSGRTHVFQRVDAELTKQLVDEDKAKTELVDPTDNKTATQKLEEIFRQNLEREKVKVQVQTLKSEDLPGVLIFDENMRRIREMAKFSPGGLDQAITDDEHTLVVNASAPVVKSLLDLQKSFNKEEDIREIVNHIYDLAFLQQGQFDKGMMQKFIKRSSTLLSKVGRAPAATTEIPQA